MFTDMRTYRQYCGLARALDVVGDRWTLLIVRELLLLGSARYTDLQHGLPGIATNLLADRLRELEDAGVVEREEAPPPVATTLYRLSARGRQLKPAVLALGTWGGPLLGAMQPDDVLRPHWLAIPLEIHLTDRDPDAPPVAIEARMDDVTMSVHAEGGRVTTTRGPTPGADLVLEGAPEVVFGLLTGALTATRARATGLKVRGTLGVLRRFRDGGHPGRRTHTR